MDHFVSLLPVIWPWTILITAQVSTLAGHLRLGLALLSVFAVAALLTGLLAPLATGLAVSGLIGAWILHRLQGRWVLIGHLALIVWCIALGAHLLPGFRNLLVLDQVRAGPDSALFSMHLNLDKPLVFFAVVLACPAMLSRKSPVRWVPLALGVVTLPLLFATGLLTGAVHPEVGLPEWWLTFALSNLFLTCLAEEAFFRGYLQTVLATRFGSAAGIAVACLLFGVAHAGGGVPLVLFASLLGLGCGLGYFATGRIWVPVVMHFAFNALHLALFTYPGPA